MPEAPPQRFRWFALAVFAVAFALRLLHVLQIRSAPFFTLLMGDSRSYDAWATRLAAGDWIGRDVFYQAPLYPYVLGVVYAVAGRNLVVVRVAQALIGSGSCVLLAYAARRMFGDAAGIAAGLILAVWAPAIFFDGLLQKSVLDVFFVCLMIWTVVRMPPLPGVRTRGRSQSGLGAWWLALGLVVGGLSLTRENSLVFVVVLTVWALCRPRPMRHASLFLAGLAIVLVPVAVRNSSLGGGFYVTTSQFGPNLFIGNNANADGTYASLRYGRGAPEYERDDATQLAERAVGRRLSPGEVSSYWRDRALAYITGSPGAWVALTGRKLALLWNATEVVDTEAQETYAEWSTPLRVLGPVTHFGLLVPLAAAGLILAWRRDERLFVLTALCAAYATSVLVFYVFARYRYPLVPFLILFASGIVRTAIRSVVRVSIPDSSIPHSRFRAAVLVALVLLVFCNWRLIPQGWMRAVSESNIGVALYADKRYDEAIEHYTRAVDFRPDYAPALNNLASAYRAAGRVDEAVTTYRRAIAVQPNFPDAEYNLANALLDKGAVGEAVGRFETAIRALPDSPDVHNNLGTALALAGRPDDAISEFRRTLALDPESAIAHRNLGNLLDLRGDQAGALDHLQRAVRADPSSGEAHYDLGLTLLEAGRVDDAIVEFRAAVERMPSSAEAHNNLGIALGQRAQFAEAAAEFREALRLHPDRDLPDVRKNLETALAAQRATPRR